MKVRFLRTCAVAGRHYEAGTEADLEERIAKELINLRRAQYLGAIIENRDPLFARPEPPTIAIGDAAEALPLKAKSKK